MDNSTVEAFARLYRGFDKKSGRYQQKGLVEGKQKIDGKAWTTDGAPTLDDFARHLSGKMPSIGVVPLRDDDTCNFGALDIDVYDLDLEALAKKIKDMPLFLTRSKSSGAHLWLFVENAIPAKDMIAALQNYAGALGFAGCEIFPKQSTRGGEEDIGNWINLPFFGDTRTALIYDSKQDKCIDLNLDQFLKIVSLYNQGTVEEILSHSKRAAKREKRTATAPLFSDGPPCNVSALLRHADGDLDLEGSRNHFMFNLGVYLTRRFETMDEVADVLNQINRGQFVLEHVRAKGEAPELVKIPAIGLPDKEVAGTIMKSLAKKEYNYKCRECPMSNLCQRALCKSRPFGVDKNKADMDFDFGALTKVKADKPYYYLTVGDSRVKFKNIDELTTQKSFINKIAEATNFMMQTMSNSEFAGMINSVLNDEKRIDVEPPQDVNDISDVLLNLQTFFLEYKTDRIEDISRKRVYHDDENKQFVFRLTFFQNYLKRNNVEHEKIGLAEELERRVGMITIDTQTLKIGDIKLLAQAVPYSVFETAGFAPREMPKEEEKKLEEKEFDL